MLMVKNIQHTSSKCRMVPMFNVSQSRSSSNWETRLLEFFRSWLLILTYRWIRTQDKRTLVTLNNYIFILIDWELFDQPNRQILFINTSFCVILMYRCADWWNHSNSELVPNHLVFYILIVKYVQTNVRFAK